MKKEINTYKENLINAIKNIDDNEIIQLKNEILKARDNEKFIYVRISQSMKDIILSNLGKLYNIHVFDQGILTAELKKQRK